MVNYDEFTNEFLQTIPFPFIYCNIDLDSNSDINLKIQYINEKCDSIFKPLDKSIGNNYITEVFKNMDLKEVQDIIDNRSSSTISFYEDSLKAILKVSLHIINNYTVIVYITDIIETMLLPEQHKNIVKAHCNDINNYSYLDTINNIFTKNTKDIMLLKDTFGNIIDCNDNFLKLHNLTKTNIIGKSSYNIYEDNVLNEFTLKTDRNVLADDSHKRYIQEYENNGNSYLFEINKYPFKDDYNNTIGIFESIKNISYIEEFNLQKVDFIANISHELRTPLNLIFTSLHVLRRLHNDTLEEFKMTKYIDAIYVNSNRLLKLANNVIDTQRLQLGLNVDSIIEENIVRYVKLIVYRVRKVAVTRNLTLIFDTDIDEKIMFFDLEKLEKILINVLSNSIKFNAENGEIFLSVKDYGNGVQIIIEDTGVGIQNDLLKDLFKQFKNIQNRFNKIAEGSGLGLYITKKLIDSQDGTIEVESKVDCGTKFTITLPSREFAKTITEVKPLEDYNQDLCSRINVELSDII